MALRSDGLDRGDEWMIDSTATRSMVRRAYSGPGLLDKFFDREMRPLLNVVQDMSGLRKFDIIGPDAQALLQQATPRNVAKLPVWRGSYTLIRDESGSVIDDGILFRLAPDIFRWCCGSEESGRVLQTLADERGLQVRVHALRGAMPNLAIQGPKSRDLLRKIALTQPHVPALDHLKRFGVTVARLRDREGAPFMLSRSGYTGELGYEVLCSNPMPSRSGMR